MVIRHWQIGQLLETLLEVPEAVSAITAELFDRAEVADLIEAALEGNIAFVPLSADPGEARVPVDLVAPGMSQPITLLAQVAGENCGGMYPVLLTALDDRQERRLRSIALSLRRNHVSQVQAPRQSSSPPRHSSIPAPRSRHRSSAPPPPEGKNPDPLVGRTIGGGRYRIEFLLGVGGMGRVYNAEHAALAKRIAVKVLDKSFQDDAQFAGRFHQEALAASKLDHRNVMHVLDFGQEPDGLLYIAMELLDGENLASKIEREGAFEFPRVLEIMNQVLAALQAAHDREIVHRDMKPENIVIVPRDDDDGRRVEFVKVCDFGLAKMTDDRASTPPGPARRGKLTMVGTVMGTPEYMSPEQCRGEVMDLRTDIYACGVILYELLTGRVPFTSDNPMDILGMHCLAQPMSPRVLNPSITIPLEAVVMKAMAKDRQYRYSSARELRDALRAATSGASTSNSAPIIEGFEATSLATNAAPAPTPPGDDSAGLQLGFFAEPAAAAPAPIPQANRAPSQAKVQPKSDAVEALLPAAEALLAGDHATREGARLALTSAGTPGVRALFRIRQVAFMDPAARPRWVATVREMGDEAIEPITEALGALDPLSPEMNVGLAEDLLRAVPEARDPDLAQQVERFLLHDRIAVRRAALSARFGVNVPGAQPAAVRALAGSDEPTILIAIAGARKLGLLDRPIVERLDEILNTGNFPDELRAAAAAALGDVGTSVKAPAESALLRAIQPKAKSFMGLLRGDSHESGEALVVEAVAASLLKIGGAAARRAVERRAIQSRGEVKAKLDLLLQRR
jgi:serine/threonine protein kinase